MTTRADAAARTANRVLDVAVELFTEKAFEDVSLEEIAQEAGVAKRTVIRRFGAKEQLFVSAMEHAVRQMQSQRNAVPVGDAATVVRALMDHYERWGTNRLRLLAQEDRIPVVANHVEEGRRLHWWWVERTFAPLLDGLDDAARKRRVAGLIAATDVYTWKLLRRDLGLSLADTERTIIELINEPRGAP